MSGGQAHGTSTLLHLCCAFAYLHFPSARIGGAIVLQEGWHTHPELRLVSSGDEAQLCTPVSPACGNAEHISARWKTKSESCEILLDLPKTLDGNAASEPSR